MRSYLFAGVVVGLLLATAATMAGEPAGSPFDISTPQSFHAQAAQVRAGLIPGGAYGFVSAQNRARVEQQIATMDALFRRYGTVQAMDGAQRVELFNAQETVNRILTRGQAGTTHCTWGQQTGSHIPRTLCWSITS